MDQVPNPRPAGGALAVRGRAARTRAACGLARGADAVREAHRRWSSPGPRRCPPPAPPGRAAAVATSLPTPAETRARAGGRAGRARRVGVAPPERPRAPLSRRPSPARRALPAERRRACSPGPAGARLLPGLPGGAGAHRWVFLSFLSFFFFFFSFFFQFI